MGRARKDEMREANHSHNQHLMTGGRSSSSSSEELPSPRGRERAEERRRDLNRDRDRDRPKDSMASFAGAGRSTSVLPTGKELASDARIAARRARFATAGGGGGASGAAVDTEPRAMAAPRAARSPSPDLRDVLEDGFIRKHLHRAEDGPIVPRTRPGKVNTVISLDHEGRKQLHQRLGEPDTQSIFRRESVRDRTAKIGPIPSSARTFNDTGAVTDDRSAVKPRYISIRGNTQRPKRKGEHLSGYTSS